MVKTASNMVELGTKAPNFLLSDALSGKKMGLPPINGFKACVIAFICNHCPFVKHINKRLALVAEDYLKKGVEFIAINSNDAQSYPDDSWEHMQEAAKFYPFPYLYDETQEVAKAYQAACTPDFFVYDAQLSLVYRGQFDNSRPGNQIEVTGDSLTHALDCLLNAKPNNQPQRPSLGCNIKWKS